MAGISKKEKEKREEAKRKVEELLGDDISFTLKDATKVASKLESIATTSDVITTSSKTESWLENEVTRLSEDNKVLEEKYIQSKKEYNKLLEEKGDVDSQVIKDKIRIIFNDMVNNYEGNNSTRTKYQQANLKHMLEKFLQNFEFLRKR